jgi:gas vesicle protein
MEVAEMNEHPSPSNGSFPGFLVGLIIGAGALLLMAPASGRDTRRRIGEGAGKLKSGARDKLSHMRGKVEHAADDLKVAVDAGREAYTRNRQARGSMARVQPL